MYQTDIINGVIAKTGIIGVIRKLLNTVSAFWRYLRRKSTAIPVQVSPKMQRTFFGLLAL